MTRIADRRPPSAPHSPPRLADALRAEWHRLRRDPSTLAHADGWAIVGGRIDDLDQVLTAVGFGVPAERRHEAALRELVLRAAGDELAARVVVQRLLPGLVAVATRRRRRDEQALGQLIGSAWIAIRTFNPARRPGNLAAALIADADYAAYRRAWRAVGGREVPVADHDERPGGADGADASSVDPYSELMHVLADARQAGVPSDDLALLQQLAETGTTAVAASLQVTSRTIRNRRDQATRRLRAAIAA